MYDMGLLDICPRKFNLKTFVISPTIGNCFFLLDEFDPRKQEYLRTEREPVAATSFIEIVNVLDHGGKIVGHVLQHRPMKRRYIGANVCTLNRKYEHEGTTVNTWEGQLINILESDFSCTVFNRCIRNNAATKRLEMI